MRWCDSNVGQARFRQYRLARAGCGPVGRCHAGNELQPCGSVRRRLPGMGRTRPRVVGFRSLGLSRPARPEGDRAHIRRRPQRIHTASTRTARKNIKHRLRFSRSARTWSACRRSRARSPPPATRSATTATRIRCSAFIRRSLSIRSWRAPSEAIADATGCPPALLRAPFGARWFGFRAGPAPSRPARRHVDRHRL